MIDVIRYACYTIARHLNQGWADVNSFHLVTETREVFTHPTRPTTHIQDTTARRQTERDSDVGKVTEMAVRFRVHAVALMLVRFVRQIIERLRPEVMTALCIEPARIFNCRALVIDTLRFRNPPDIKSRLRFLAITRSSFRITVGAERGNTLEPGHLGGNQVRNFFRHPTQD